MATNQLGKKAFAQALEKLLETTSLDKIRVTHLAKETGTTPQAFYYHFQDKYDLVAWIYLDDFRKIVSNDNQSFSATQIMQLILQFEKRKIFYQKVFSDTSQNAIEDYAYKHSDNFTRRAVENHQGTPMTFQQEIAIRYHSHGVLGLLKDWLFDNLEIDIQQLASFQYEQTPDFLKKALANYNYDDMT